MLNSEEAKGKPTWGKKQAAHMKRGDRTCKGRQQDMEAYPVGSFTCTTETAGERLVL